jgi:hypothetical protein
VQSQLEEIPDILTNISETQIASMQLHLSRVWHRFAYTSTSTIQQVQHAFPTPITRYGFYIWRKAKARPSAISVACLKAVIYIYQISCALEVFVCKLDISLTNLILYVSAFHNSMQTIIGVDSLRSVSSECVALC